MPHGTPDWGLVGPRTTTYGLDDLGEHATRLGAASEYDRRGETVFATIFENGLGSCGVNVNLAGNDVRLFAGGARQGAYCVQMHNTYNLLGWTILEKRFSYPVASGLAVEITFSTHTDLFWLSVRIRMMDGANEHDAEIRWNHNTNQLEAINPAAAFVPFATVLALREGVPCQHTLKMVMDFNTGMYMRCLLNEQSFPLRHLPYYNPGGGVPTWAMAEVEIGADDTKDVTVYVDRFIITQNEP